MIRDVCVADTAGVVELAVEAGLFPVDESAVVAGLVEHFFATGVALGHGFVVEEDEGRLVGVAYYEPVEATDRTWSLTMLGVRPDRRRGGLGARLVAHAEDELRSRGQRLLLVETSGVKAFAAARAFYPACGYRQEAQVADYWAPGDDMVLFAKALDASGVGRDGPVGTAGAGREVVSGIVPFAGGAEAPRGSSTGRPRPARSADLDAVVDLAEAFYGEDGFSTSRGELRAALEGLLDGRRRGEAHVAVVDAGPGGPTGSWRGPVGFAVTTTGSGLENGRVAELEDLYVVPEARGRGWGAALMADSSEWASRQGASHLEVVIAAGPEQTRLRSFYRRSGFTTPRTLLRKVLP